MSSYIPPHQRKPDPLSKDNFPSLTGSPVRSNANPWNQSFASMARDWNKKTEDDTVRREYEKEQERQRLKREQIERNSVFVYKYADDGYESNYSIPENLGKEDKSSDDWKTVERKQRVELTTEERYEKMQRELEEEDKQRELEETTHGNEEWDYRDRRTIS